MVFPEPVTPTGLEVEDLDFKAGTVRVRQQIVGPDIGEPYLAGPKTHESYRTVPVAKIAMDAVAAHLERYPAQRVDIEDRTNPRKPKRRKALLVFTNERREAIRRAAWASVWANVEKAANKALRRDYEVAQKKWERRRAARRAKAQSWSWFRRTRGCTISATSTPRC